VHHQGGEARFGASGTPGAISRDALDRLVAVGRSHGGLTTEDLRRALPVDGMSAEDLALVVVHLEDEGIPVELDESHLGLTRAEGCSPGSGPDGGVIVLPPVDSVPNPPRSRPPGNSRPLPSPEALAAEPSRGPRDGMNPKGAVIVGLVLLAIAALGIVLASG
jgi:sigma-70-like protein